MTERDRIFWKFGRDALTLNLSPDARRAMFQAAEKELAVLGVADVLEEPSNEDSLFERCVLAALQGVVSSEQQKFDCVNSMQTARKAIDIARHVVRELGKDQ